MIANRNAAGLALSVYTATYDDVDNRLSVQELDGVRVTYAYDASYQLGNEQRSGANAYQTTYSYDGVGNRLTMNAGGQVTTYAYNAANALTLLRPATGQPTTSSYDGNGNLSGENAGGSLTTYTWDTENRLLTVSAASGIETYTYSADGLRQKKVSASGTVFFVRDGENVLIETDGSLVTQAVYTDLPGLWGGKFSLRRSGSSRFYVPDHQGNSRQLTDASQTVTDTLLVDAWGREITSSGATVNPFKAFGQWGYYRDTLSRLQVGQRHLRVDLGRFLSQDPWTHATPLELYAYAKNNPVNQADPAGLYIIKLCKFRVKGPGQDSSPVIQGTVSRAVSIWQTLIESGVSIDNSEPVRELDERACFCVDWVGGQRGQFTTVYLYNWDNNLLPGKEFGHVRGLVEAALEKYIESVHKKTPKDCAFIVWTGLWSLPKDQGTRAYANPPTGQCGGSGYIPGQVYNFHLNKEEQFPVPMDGLIAHELGHSLWRLEHALCGLMYGFLNIRKHWSPECVSCQTYEELTRCNVFVHPDRICETDLERFFPGHPDACQPDGGGTGRGVPRAIRPRKITFVNSIGCDRALEGRDCSLL